MRAPKLAAEALCEAVSSGLYDGYAASAGLPSCRSAIAKHFSERLPKEHALTTADVLMTHGCSAALSLALGSVANNGCNVLLPRPGFPLYTTLCEYYGIEPRFYDLHPAQGWMADPAAIKAATDANTLAIVVCNPGNPTGCVYTTEQLRAYIAVAKELGLFIIADEVYADIVWADGASFTPIASLTSDVPVLSVGAVSKRFLLPGWRCGWLLVNDRHGMLSGAGVIDALQHLTQMTIGPTVVCQAAVPKLFASTSRAWHDEVCAGYRTASNVCCLGAASAPGMKVEARPKGAMYLLVRLLRDSFDAPACSSDVAWCAQLQKEENVMLLPGSAFGAPGCVRMVLCAPEKVLEEAWLRIEAFCKRHLRKAAAAPAGPVLLWDTGLTRSL